MSILNIFGKIGDIIYEPVKLMTDWSREPLKTREHQRSIDVLKHKTKAESEARMNEASHHANIEERRKILDADLEIKKKTEVQRILAEINEIQKDKDFQRMKAVSDAIMQYQEYLTKLNVNAINAIGHMQLDLREKAQQLVHDKTIKYKQIQDSAHTQAVEEILRIEKEFSGNDAAKSILYRSVDSRLANIITTAHNFLIELNNDIAVLNNSINKLTEQGQTFIENHLEKFHVVTGGDFLPNPTVTSNHSSNKILPKI